MYFYSNYNAVKNVYGIEIVGVMPVEVAQKCPCQNTQNGGVHNFYKISPIKKLFQI